MRAYTVEFENRPEVKNQLEDIKRICIPIISMQSI
jgi:hypothetical protein